MIHLYPIGDLFVPRKRPGRPVFHEAVKVYARAWGNGDIQDHGPSIRAQWMAFAAVTNQSARFYRTKRAAIRAAKREV